MVLWARSLPSKGENMPVNFEEKNLSEVQERNFGGLHFNFEKHSSVFIYSMGERPTILPLSSEQLGHIFGLVEKGERS